MNKMTVPVTLSGVRDELREYLADVLYCDAAEIEDDVPFQELGLDSVLGVDLLMMINNRYCLHERVHVLYDHPTLHKIAEHVQATRPTVGSRTEGS